MAGENGQQTGTLTYLNEVSKEPYRYGFYRTVRVINCLNPDKPVTGASYRPSEDPIRFTQEPYMAFAPSTLHALDMKVDSKNPYPRLSQNFMGLFGPNGPMPAHITEYARDRWRHHRDSSFMGFADIFHHRVISLFYRAWAVAQPATQLDHPKSDSFSRQLGSLVGLGSPGMSDRDDFQHMAKLHFAGHLSSLPRHTPGLESMISGYFEIKARVIEFVAHWLSIPGGDRLRLGAGSATGRLGQDTVIGERVWQRQDKFRLRLGPLKLKEYESFLPTGRAFKGLVAAVRNYLGIELLWEANLVLNGREKPVTCLGKSGTLGWTSWLESDSTEKEISDLVLQVNNYTSV
jgi:type VI secretion system protein ImpH